MNKHDALSIFPKAKASVPSGSDGQVATVNDQRYKLGVRVNGEVAPVTPLETTEKIEMVVDPVGGTSPAAYVIVTNQAEYDALGDDLLYLQDVLDILPQTLGAVVNVTVKAGTLAAKPGASGVGLDIPIVDGWGRTLAAGASCITNDTGNGNGAILFNGESNTIIDAAQAGTSTTDTVVRSAGTWTAHERRGDFVLITAGAGAGSRVLIEDNDTTTLYLKWDLASTGSVTFEVVEPAAVMAPGVYYGVFFISGDIVTQFSWIKFGTSVSPMTTMIVGGQLSFEECKMLCDEISLFGAVRCVTEISFWKCYVVSTGISTSYGAVVRSNNCVLAVVGTDGPVVEAVFGLLVVLQTTFVAFESSGYSLPLIIMKSQSTVCFQYDNKLEGGSTADGIQVQPGARLIFDNPEIEINNCDVALDIQSDVFGAPAFTGSGNVTGIKLSDGATLTTDDPSGLGATTEIDLDGEAIDYSELASGDSIIGLKGSKIVRT